MLIGFSSSSSVWHVKSLQVSAGSACQIIRDSLSVEGWGVSGLDLFGGPPVLPLLPESLASGLEKLCSKVSVGGGRGDLESVGQMGQETLSLLAPGLPAQA